MGLHVLLDLAASMHGDRTAVGSGPNAITFRELDELSRGAAAALRDSGASRIAFVGVHGPAFAVTLFGAARAGMPITPLNYRLSDEELSGLLARLPDSLMVADPDPRSRLGLNSLSTADLLAAAGERARADPDNAAAEPEDDGPAVALFTSGTTSAPKAVPLTHDNLTSYVLQTLEPGAAEADECALISVPPYHVAGIAAVLTNTYAGRRMVFLPRFTPEDWLATVRTEGVTTAMVVPTMLARITGALDGAPADTPTLRALSYGGAKLPATVLEQALAAFPGTGFTHAYGLTETSSTIAVLGPDDHRAALGSAEERVRRRLGSAGRAVPGVELAVRLPGGSTAPPGASGELFVRGPQVSGRYAGADGWFATRDRAWLDEDGYLFVDGRADDTIIRGAENIAPAEIEGVLLRHPQVREAAVVGLPDEEWGERIAAVVVPTPGAEPDPDDLRAWARGRLRGAKTPAQIEVWPSLPYNDLGKLLRRDVVAQLAATSVRSVS